MYCDITAFILRSESPKNSFVFKGPVSGLNPELVLRVKLGGDSCTLASLNGRMIPSSKPEQCGTNRD